MSNRFRMRFVVATILAVTGGVVCGRAGDPAPAVRVDPAELRRALIAVVDGQLRAFRANDYEAAFAFAAAVMRRDLTLAQFTELVKGSYPVIAGNTEATFGVAHDFETRALLSVAVTAGDKTVRYAYLLQKEPDGWRIAGVAAEPPSAAKTL